MCSTKRSRFYKCKSVIPSPLNQNKTKVFILALSLFSFSLILESVQSFSKANAQDSLGKTIQHFSNNLLSGINNQTQSNLNQPLQSSTNDNSINCDGNNSFLSQTQTSNDGQITTTTKSDCNGSTSVQSPIDSQR